MGSRAGLDESVCENCPLVQAINEAWADFELFKTTTEIVGIDAGSDSKVPETITSQVISAYEHNLSRYESVLTKLSEYTKNNGCSGRQSGSWTGIFCGVEGRLREMGVTVPEYELRGSA